jgi:hypothetical protein
MIWFPDDPRGNLARYGDLDFQAPIVRTILRGRSGNQRNDKKRLGRGALKMKMKTNVGVKTHPIGNMGYLHFWYANNKSRGTKNVTVVWSLEKSRTPLARQQVAQVATTRTCGWHGNVNLSKKVLAELGL